jgi:hypothetical protein
MTAEEAVEAATAIQPKVAIPECMWVRESGLWRMLSALKRKLRFRCS